MRKVLFAIKPQKIWQQKRDQYNNDDRGDEEDLDLDQDEEVDDERGIEIKCGKSKSVT